MLVDDDMCIGCKLCAWACPYGARELDEDEGVMKKCTLCVDRIYNETIARGASASRPACWPARPRRGISAISAIPTSRSRELVAERGGLDLMPELGYRPVNNYLPPRRRAATPPRRVEDAADADGHQEPRCCAGSTASSDPMHPAPSIVFFTTASGAGYGLLFWLGLLRPVGLLPASAGLRAALRWRSRCC